MLQNPVSYNVERASGAVGDRADASVVTCVKIVQETIYLLSIYDKSERDSVSDKELDTMLGEAGLDG
ncbi:hypothetical protein [Spirosoma spitsbergense]|uniref:hypothetical protein n=1 Tax=Spirosoma spitsbergense TaxID=431554 RepID=UPI00039EBB47